MERREILTHAASRMNREDIVPRERSQTQQDSVAQSHFHEVPTFVRFAETEDTMVAAVANAGRGGEFMFNGYRVSALGAETILEMVGGDSDATLHRECV